MVYEIRIDGVELNKGMVRGVDSFNGRRIIPQRRSVSTTLPGYAGSSVTLGEFEPSQFSIGMWFVGQRTVRDGVNMPGDPYPLYLENELDEVLRLLVPRRLLRFEWLSPKGWRWADVRVAAVVSPTVNEVEGTAYLTVAFENPDCFWRGATLSETVVGINGIARALPGYSECTGVDTAAVLRINGPVTNPSVTIGRDTFTWTGSISSGQWIEFNNKTRRAVNQAGNSLAPMMGQTSLRFFEIAPGDQIKVSATGVTSSSSYKLTYTETYT